MSIFVDYLKSAICIKNAAIEEQGCKTFYDELLQEINSPSESTTLCWYVVLIPTYVISYGMHSGEQINFPAHKKSRIFWREIFKMKYF